MAIDSASKRQSALTFGLPFMRGAIPDGVIDQGDRQNIAFFYSGILATIGVVFETISLSMQIEQSISKNIIVVRNINRSANISQQIDFELEG